MVEEEIRNVTVVGGSETADVSYCDVRRDFSYKRYVRMERVVPDNIFFTKNIYTGRFIMYSVITKMYYTKTIGHVFMKPVQTEGTTQKLFSQ